MKAVDKYLLMPKISQFSGSYSVRIAKSLPIYTPIFSKNSAVFAGFFCKDLRFFCYVKKSHTHISRGGLL